MNLLHTIGLMTRAEHERIVGKSFDEVRALCSHLWVRHYREKAPNWLPLDTLPGVISQLDNMIAGISTPLADQLVIASERDEYEAKFKRAATDLAAQAEEIAQMKVDMSRAAEAADNYLNWIAGLEAEVQALRPDAEAMRKKRAADRKRMAGKRNG